MKSVAMRRRARGVATVEVAVVLPLILLMLFVFVETGHFVNCSQIVHSAARQGARTAVRLKNSNSEVRAAVLRALGNSIVVDPNQVTVRLSKLNSAGGEDYQVQSLDMNEQGAAVRILVEVPYANFRPPSSFLGLANRKVSSAVVMRRRK